MIPKIRKYQLKKATHEQYADVCDKLGNALQLLALIDHDLDEHLIDAMTLLHRQSLRLSEVALRSE